MIDEMRTQHAEEFTEWTLPVPADSTKEGTADLSSSAYKKRLHALQKQLREIPALLKKRGQSMILVLEGWDASGKGGTIRRITDAIREDRIQVFPTAAPTAEEQARHYLWRFWRTVPPTGHIAVYDRSWYGRVLVERVEGLTPEQSWKRAYKEIRDFEQTLTDNNCILCKFWLEISPQEQLSRFEARLQDPQKRHKLTDEDWRNRSQREAYERALDDMLRETDTDFAPWEIIPAENKRIARLTVMKAVLASMQPSDRRD